MHEDSIATSVRNLLFHCGRARSGQSLLVAYEPPEFGYFDGEVVDCVVSEATKLGLATTQTCVGFDPDTPAFPPDFLKQMAQSDIVVFLARLGDQLRFSEMPDDLIIINSYTLNKTLLASEFATAHYDAFVALKTAVDRLVAGSTEIAINCPAGTSVRGQANLAGVPASDTSLKRFPMSVFSPVPAEGFSGKVALGGFLTGTGSHFYDEYTTEFEGQTFALLHEGRLAGFEGKAADVAKANAHYDRVTAFYDLDRNFVHSWHAGIHPGCGFPWNIAENYHTWGGAAFGNPRVLHFHTCGAYAPGEISWNVFDPTIEIDGLALWQNGRFRADLLPEGPGILAKYSCAKALFDNPNRAIGLTGA